MERGFDYNDENYFPTEGGNPKKVFSSKKSALKALDEKNSEEFLKIIEDGSIREFGYCLSDILDTSKDKKLEVDDLFLKLFKKTPEEWWESYNDIGFKVTPNKSQLKKLIDCFNFNFYEVVEVQKG